AGASAPFPAFPPPPTARPVTSRSAGMARVALLPSHLTNPVDRSVRVMIFAVRSSRSTADGKKGKRAPKSARRFELETPGLDALRARHAPCSTCSMLDALRARHAPCSTRSVLARHLRPLRPVPTRTAGFDRDSYHLTTTWLPSYQLDHAVDLPSPPSHGARL